MKKTVGRPRTLSGQQICTTLQLEPQHVEKIRRWADARGIGGGLGATVRDIIDAVFEGVTWEAVEERARREFLRG